MSLPLLGSRGTLATIVEVDGRAAFGAGTSDGSGQLDATVTLRNPTELRLALPEGRGSIVGALGTDGKMRLKLAVPGGVEQLEGEVVVNGPLVLSMPLPGGDATLETSAAINGTTTIRTTAPGCFRLDAQGAVNAPIALRLPVPGGRGDLDVNVALTSDATLRMALPGWHGQLQAHGLVTGQAALTLALPTGSGQITTRNSISTPVTLLVVMPDGRAKLGADGSVTSEVELNLVLPRGGQAQARGTLQSRVHGVLFLPSGRGKLQADAPIHTILRLKELALPHMRGVLTADISIDGAADLTIGMPGYAAQLQLRFEAALPLAPLVRIVQAEVERHVRVEHMEVRHPRLSSPHDLALPLYIEARKGVLVRIELTAYLHIDPRSKQVELRSVHGRGLNAAGRAALSLYLNRKVLKPLHGMRLFDPSTMLPPMACIDALTFKAGSPDGLVIAGEMTFGSASSS